MTTSIRIMHGDCLALLRTLAPESVDSIITDPPYGLGAPPPIEAVLRAWLDGLEYRAKGRGFMGHTWDAFVPGPEIWRECLRVLKPGGHLLAFFGTRTVDVGGLAIRLAGFEIRDQVAWFYGTGFPKSLDVSKAIDKARDDTEDVRRVCRWLRSKMQKSGATSASIAERFGFHPRMVDHWAARDTDSQPTLPTLAQWDSLRAVLRFGEDMDAEVLRLNLRKGQPGEAWEGRPITGVVEEWANRTNYAITSHDGLRRDIPATPEAAAWEGWGTALKPAHEPIIVARKPLAARTVAAQVLISGTGAINIDACRVPASEEGSAPGRWPANVVLDESAAEMLDDKGGGASRFFYCAKASKAERGEGNGHPTVKPLSLMRWLVRLVTPPRGCVLDPFAGSGTTLLAAREEGFNALGIEQDAGYVEIIRRRLGEGSC